MRVTILPIAVSAGLVFVASTQLPPQSKAETGAGMLQSSMAFSAAAKRKQTHAAPPVYGTRPHFGGPADPSFGPDGRPYKVPEYLRNQCYIDDGYGRFSACNNRN